MPLYQVTVLHNVHSSPHVRHVLLYFADGLALVPHQQPQLPHAVVLHLRGDSGHGLLVLCSAPSVTQPVFTITEKAPTRAFSWLKAPTSALTFKTLLRHYAKHSNRR